MNALINILVLLIISLICYLIYSILSNTLTLNKLALKFKNYIKRIYNKINIFLKIEQLLNKIKFIYNFNQKVINSLNILIISFFLAIFSSTYFFIRYKIILSSIMILIIVFLIPTFFLEIIQRSIKYKLIQEFSIYIVNLYSFSKNTNNVILALSKVEGDKKINKYLTFFNDLVKNGFNVLQAFDILIEKINIKEINNMFQILKTCYINGGDLELALSKYSNYYKEIINLKNKKINSNISLLIMLGILILINIILLFGFCLNNLEYKNIILNTIFGKIIFNLNILVYLITFFYIRKIINKE